MELVATLIAAPDGGRLTEGTAARIRGALEAAARLRELLAEHVHVR